MKFALALAALPAMASAFVAAPAQHASQATSLSAVPDSSEWVGYYTKYDDSQVVKTSADTGFDPLGFSKTEAGLFWMREAEIKHCRLAMLAAASWPIAETLDKPLANMFGLQPLVDASDRNPSLLNGGLEKVSLSYWAAILIAAAGIDLYQINKANAEPDYTPGDLGFDPLGLFPKDKAGQEKMMAKELRNGRLAMIAITAFAAQEAIYNTGIVDQEPFGSVGLF